MFHIMLNVLNKSYQIFKVILVLFILFKNLYNKLLTITCFGALLTAYAYFLYYIKQFGNIYTKNT